MNLKTVLSHGLWWGVSIMLLGACSGPHYMESEPLHLGASPYVEVGALDMAQMQAPASPKKTSKSLNSFSNNRLSQGYQQTPMPKAAPRKMLYDGYLVQSTRSPKMILDSATKIVELFGGRAHRRGDKDALFKVPVDSFDLAFKALIPLAPILSKSIQSSDITHSYQDVELRLRLAQSKVLKLKELYKKAKDPNEKLRLLQELQVANEDLIAIQERMSSLKDLAAFSRIHLNLKEPQGELVHKQQIYPKAFSWIRKLDPHSRNKWDFIKLDIQVPEKMLYLDNRDIWTVTSAGGTTAWAYKLSNKPKGSSKFWGQAIYRYLGSSYPKISKEEGENYYLVKCKSADLEPYHYWVAVWVVKDEIRVFETYFPSNEEENSYAPGLLKSFLKKVQDDK